MADEYAEKINREYALDDFHAVFGRDNWKLMGPENTIIVLDTGETLTAKQVVERIDATRSK